MTAVEEVARKLGELAERVEAIGIVQAGLFAYENSGLTGRREVIATAAHCFTVAAALRASAAVSGEG